MNSVAELVPLEPFLPTASFGVLNDASLITTKGDVPFPKWMDASWHNCIVGCMHCQRVCPQNKEVIQWTGEEEEFSEEETALLLERVPHDKLPATTLRKLERLSLVDYIDRLPRNLGIFFKNHEQSKFE